MEALIRCLREKQYGGSGRLAPLPPDAAGRAAQLHQRLLTAAGPSVDSSEHARQNLVQKLLLWDISRGTVQEPGSWQVLLRMGLLDEPDTIPCDLQGYNLQAWCSCPLLLLTCYVRLAKPALQQHPAALEVTRADPARVQAALVAFKTPTELPQASHNSTETLSRHAV